MMSRAHRAVGRSEQLDERCRDVLQGSRGRSREVRPRQVGSLARVSRRARIEVCACRVMWRTSAPLSCRASSKSLSLALSASTRSAMVTFRVAATLARAWTVGTTSPRSSSDTYPRPRPTTSTNASKVNSFSSRRARMRAPTRAARGSGFLRCRALGRREGMATAIYRRQHP